MEGEFVVGEGEYFVMGDNRDNSFDSRYWGFLDRDLIMGRAMAVLWSWEYLEDVPQTTGPFSGFELWWYNIKHLPQLVSHTRWDRFGKIPN